jgi:hypothetical protein
VCGREGEGERERGGGREIDRERERERERERDGHKIKKMHYCVNNKYTDMYLHYFTK